MNISENHRQDLFRFEQILHQLQSKVTDIGHDDASAINSRLGRIEDSIKLREKTAHKNKVIRILSYSLVGMVALVSILSWYGSIVRNERNELLKVE